MPEKAPGREGRWKSEVSFSTNQAGLALLRGPENGMALPQQHWPLSCPICRPVTYHHLENAEIGIRHVPKCPDATDKEHIKDGMQAGGNGTEASEGWTTSWREQTPNCPQLANSLDLMTH